MAHQNPHGRLTAEEYKKIYAEVQQDWKDILEQLDRRKSGSFVSPTARTVKAITPSEAIQKTIQDAAMVKQMEVEAQHCMEVIVALVRKMGGTVKLSYAELAEADVKELTIFRQDDNQSIVLTVRAFHEEPAQRPGREVKIRRKGRF